MSQHVTINISQYITSCNAYCRDNSIGRSKNSQHRYQFRQLPRQTASYLHQTTLAVEIVLQQYPRLLPCMSCWMLRSILDYYSLLVTSIRNSMDDAFCQVWKLEVHCCCTGKCNRNPISKPKSGLLTLQILKHYKRPQATCNQFGRYSKVCEQKQSPPAAVPLQTQQSDIVDRILRDATYPPEQYPNWTL